MRVRINIIAQFISCMMISGVAFAATGIMSKYGTIQGVDGYSTNPFGSSKTYSYSNRMPVPVYENGPDVKTDECLSIVSNMVANACANMQNCANASLSDIRPGIILQLSRMSGGNYATACAGYMDEAFRQYKQSHAHLPQNGNTSFPATTAPTQPTNTNKSAIPLNNFFETQKPAWAIEMQERATELAEFQADNGKIYSELEPTAFPTTYADLSFSERMANNKAGYEPYQGKSAFKPIDIESLEDYNKRMTPTDEEYRKRCRNLLDELIRKLRKATSNKCKEILNQLKDMDKANNWQYNCEKNTDETLKKLEELKQAAIDNGCFNIQSGGQQNNFNDKEPDNLKDKELEDLKDKERDKILEQPTDAIRVELPPEVRYPDIPINTYYILITEKKYELPYDFVSHTATEDFTECINAIRQDELLLFIDSTTGKIIPDFPTKQQAQAFIDNTCNQSTSINTYNNCCKDKYLYIVNSQNNLSEDEHHYE